MGELLDIWCIRQRLRRTIVVTRLCQLNRACHLYIRLRQLSERPRISTPRHRGESYHTQTPQCILSSTETNPQHPEPPSSIDGRHPQALYKHWGWLIRSLFSRGDEGLPRGLIGFTRVLPTSQGVSFQVLTNEWEVRSLVQEMPSSLTLCTLLLQFLVILGVLCIVVYYKQYRRDPPLVETRTCAYPGTYMHTRPHPHITIIPILSVYCPRRNALR